MKFSLPLQSVQGEGVGGSDITKNVGNRMRFRTVKLSTVGNTVTRKHNNVGVRSVTR